MACVEAPKPRAAANSFLVSFAQTWGTPVTLGIQVDAMKSAASKHQRSPSCLAVLSSLLEAKMTKFVFASERISLFTETLKLHSCYLLFSIFSFLLRECLLVYPRLASKCPSTCLSLPCAEITGMYHSTRIQRRHVFPFYFFLVLAIEHVVIHQGVR